MADKLQRVDRLTINILVDNTIEWFSPLPKEFTHELNQHLQHADIDPVTGVPIMELDNACCGAHGLSILLTTEKAGSKYSLLFDTGPDSRAFERNYDSLRIQKLFTIERVVLSHWHRDHSGGMTQLLKLLAEERDRKAPNTTGGLVTLDLHPDRPSARGVARPPSYDKVVARLPEDPSFKELEALGGTVELHPDAHVVGNSTVYVSGEIPRVTEFEAGIQGGKRWVEGKGGAGKWVDEPHIMEERYVAVDVENKGLVIFSACSHAGIVNVVRDAVAKFDRPVHMILAGCHLAPPDHHNRIGPTVEFLSRKVTPRPKYIVPLHCTGSKAKVALANEFGEGCVLVGVGIKVEV